MSRRSALPAYFPFLMGIVGIELGKASEANLPGFAFVRHGNVCATVMYVQLKIGFGSLKEMWYFMSVCP